MTASRVTHSFVLVIGLAAVVAIAGCSSQKPSIRATGPWAAEITREHEKATSEEVRKALEDSFVSDQEYAEMKARFTECLRAAGITLESYGIGGYGTTFAPPITSDHAHRKTNECAASTGPDSVGFLYFQMRANPENEDQVPLIVQCFKDKGLVESSYSVEDYTAGDLSFADHDSDKRAELDACNTDPRGNFRD